MKAGGPHILALTPDLSRNSSITAWQFRGALQRAGFGVTLAGHAAGTLWKPLGHELQHALVLRGFGKIDDPAGDPGFVYAFKALPTSLGHGMREARRRDVPLGLHLDDWDAGFFRGQSRVKRLWWGLRALNDPNGELWLQLFDRLVPRADVLTVSTRALQRRYGGTVVRQGVDTTRLDPASFGREEARERLGIPTGRPVVLFLGTPRLHKGLEALLSLSDLAEAIWIVGLLPGTEAEAGLDPAQLERVNVRPPVSYDEAAWFLAASDVFVVPQVDTPFAAHQVPAKILKAMALGAAIVTTDVGDAAEILGGTPPAGLVVPPGEPGLLSGAIRDLLGDAHRRTALGAEARRRSVSSFGWDAMARDLGSALAPVLGV